jgi:hypothetical protein
MAQILASRICIARIVFQKFLRNFLSLLSLLSLCARVTQCFFLGAKFRQNMKNTSKNGIFNCNISPFFFPGNNFKISRKKLFPNFWPFLDSNLSLVAFFLKLFFTI